MIDGRRMRTVWLGVGIGLVLGAGAASAHAADMAPTTVSTTTASAEAPQESPMQADLSARVVEGMRRLFAHDYSGAVDRLSAAAEADPNDPAARYYLGYTYYRMGDFGQARTAFAEAYRIDPHFSPEPKAP
jgi:Flp pilus assembly protein TadD